MDKFLAFMIRDEKMAMKNLLRTREREEDKIRDKILKGQMEPISEVKLKLMVLKLADHKVQHEKDSDGDSHGSDKSCEHELGIIHNLDHGSDHQHDDNEGHSHNNLTKKENRDPDNVSYKLDINEN